MSASLLTRAGTALAAAAFFLSLGLESALAHAPQGAWTLRAGTVSGHGLRPGWRGNSWNWRSQHGWNRWSRNGWYWNRAGLYDSGYWFSPDASASPAVDGDGPTAVIGGPEINVFPASTPGSFDRSADGSCVIHTLTYDGAAKYIGERQTPEC
jgi:hypothetical protein